MTGLRDAIRAVSADRAGRLLQCPVEVVSVSDVSPSFRRVTVTGDGLAAYGDPMPADAFRLFPPAAGGTGDGPGRSRAFTVRRFDPQSRRLTFDAVVHGPGLVARWLDELAVGDRVDIVGMRTEFVTGSRAAGRPADLTILVSDTSGFPAVAAIVAALPPRQPVTVLISGAAPADHPLLPDRPGADVSWVPAGGLAAAVRALPRPHGSARAWAAAEAGEVRVIRRILLDHLGVPRDDMHASAYWKAGTTSDDIDAQGARRYAEAVAAGRDVTDPAVLEELAFS